MLVGRGRGSRMFEERGGLRGGVGRLHLQRNVRSPKQGEGRERQRCGQGEKDGTYKE